jgi:hypothetical protein
MIAAFWSSMLGTLIFLAIGSWQLWSTADHWRGDGMHSPTEVDLTFIGAYIGFAAVILDAGCMWNHRSIISGDEVRVLKEASKPLLHMPILVLVPIMQVLGILLILLPWTTYHLYIASSGEQTTISPNFSTYTFDSQVPLTFFFTVFAIIWTADFILSFGQMLMVIAIATDQLATEPYGDIGEERRTKGYRILKKVLVSRLS